MTEFRETAFLWDIITPHSISVVFGFAFFYIPIYGNFVPVKPYTDEENIFSETKNQSV